MSVARRVTGGFALAALLLAASTAGARADGLVAVLQALDKVTARISDLRAPLDQTVKFGTLEITARACHKAPPEEPPENAAFLEIRELRRDEPPRVLFSGWMFSSSPGLSTLEHPVYDVWVVDCLSEPVPAVPSGSSAE
jgi:hypothetical protein